MGWTIYSSGGTAKAVSEANVPVKDVSELVGGDAILGHRVVTLSREVHAGLLADADSEADMTELASLNIPFIDLVAVDMYPLEEEIHAEGANAKSILEKTDIGGPTMLRAGAKGRRIVLSVSEQRDAVIDWLKAGSPDAKGFREQLAARAEYESARYILQSAKYLGGADVDGWVGRLVSPTKYGENPQQATAGLYVDNRVDIDPLGLDQFTHQKGWELSYINETDIARLTTTASFVAAVFETNFASVPALAIGVKHGNACGAGVAKTHVEAVKKMLEGDLIAIFGGVIMINGTIDADVATTLMEHGMPDGQRRLLDGVVGADFTDEAVAILSRAKLRIVTNRALASLGHKSLDSSRMRRMVRGGALVQDNYSFVPNFSDDSLSRHGKITDQQLRDVALAWAVGSSSNSNTICFVSKGKLLANGVGQQDRVGAATLGLARAKKSGHDLAGSCAYSDSFFPFTDGPQMLVDAGISAVMTSSGSVKDEAVIETFAHGNVSVVMVPDKVGRGFFGH